MRPLPSREEVQEWIGLFGSWAPEGTTDTHIADRVWSSGWGKLLIVTVGTTHGPVAVGWRWI